ncbi:right-handed parallel beta-helix repeat-containing protein [Candidatus Woesearchaeota archaeon]|nr:right-handed parallel beta-helix repeat-containing protein [Candidatus Woesearchaeota archaeon]
MKKTILILASLVLMVGLAGAVGAEVLPDCDINVPLDYATVQAAINAASPGDTICIADGTYGVSALYYSVAGISKPLTLLAAGDNVVFDCGGTGWGIGFRVAGVSDVTIDGIKITNCESGIVLEKSVSNIEIKNCDVHDNLNYGIFSFNAVVDGLAVDNVKLRGTKYYEGFFLDKAVTVNNLQMSNVEITDNNEFGFMSYGTINTAVLDTLTVEGNSIGSGYGFGLALKGTANDVAIKNSVFSNNMEHGIALGFWGTFKVPLSTTGITIENCNFEPGFAWGSILIDGTTSGADNIVINYNNFGKFWSWGVENYAAAKANALYNWWGCQTGPGGGCVYVKNSYYDPWLCGPAPTGAIAYDNDGDGYRCNDCDDTDSKTYPGAGEICDGKDNDCDGVTPLDEVDSDGDGTAPCEGDCNDEDPEINPSALDIPGNDADENCDGNLLCDPAAVWKNHGKFVSCVAREAEALFEAGEITEEEKCDIISEAAKSDIGKK